MSEARYRAAEKIARLGHWERNYKTDTVFWSEGVFDVFGLPPGGAAPSFDEFLALVHPEDRGPFGQAIKAALASRQALDAEFRIQRPDGELRYIHTRAMPVRDASGEFKMLSGILQDITERKRAEEVLRQSEERYRALVETTDTGYVILDLKGMVLDANPEYVRLSGHRDLNEIRGRSVVEWTADYEREKNAKAVAQCTKEGYIRNLELDYVDAHGKVTPIDVNATAAEKDGTPRILALCRDITERKRAEEALRKSEEKSRIVADFTHDWEYLDCAGPTDALRVAFVRADHRLSSGGFRGRSLASGAHRPSL